MSKPIDCYKDRQVTKFNHPTKYFDGYYLWRNDCLVLNWKDENEWKEIFRSKDNDKIKQFLKDVYKDTLYTLLSYYAEYEGRLEECYQTLENFQKGFVLIHKENQYEVRKFIGSFYFGASDYTLEDAEAEYYSANDEEMCREFNTCEFSKIIDLADDIDNYIFFVSSIEQDKENMDYCIQEDDL